MKCYIVNGQGIDHIKLVERETPKINPLEVLVQVKACSLNYRDLMVAKGQYTPDNLNPHIALSDMAGVVLEVGSDVTDLKPGDRVINAPFRHWPAGKLRYNWSKTFVGGNGVDGVLAEQIAYPADSLVKIPPHLDFKEASTFTIAGLTAWSAVVTHGKTLPGEWVLLQGSGGVSVFAAQLAHAMGANTIMTTSSKEKGALVKAKYGITEIVNYRDADWPKQVKDLTGGCGVDVVVDVVGGNTLASSLGICNFGARVSVVGVLDKPESNINIRHLLSRQIQINGIFMESTQELRALMRAVATLKLKPHVDQVFPFAKAVEAYKYFASQEHVGKVVIEL